MEKNIDDFLNDMTESKKDERMNTPGFKLSPEEIKNLATRLTHITQLGKKLDDINKFRKLIKSTKKYNFDISKSLSILGLTNDEKDSDENDDDNTQNYKIEVSSTLKKKIKKVDEIFSSTENDDLSDKQKEDIEKAAEEILDFFKTSTNKKSHIDKDFKETGMNTWEVKAEQTFPCKLEIGNKNYYGLVRPPTGVITWQGITARSKARELGVPTKIPLMNKGDKKNPNFIVKRGADEFGKFMSKFQNTVQNDIDFDYDDSSKAKEKVVDAMKISGASYDSKAYITKKRLNNAEGAIDKIKEKDIEAMMDEALSTDDQKYLFTEGFTKNVSFWQNIAKIL